MLALQLSSKELTQLGLFLLRGEWNDARVMLADGARRMSDECRHPPDGFNLFLDWLASEKQLRIPCQSSNLNVWPRQVNREFASAGVELLMLAGKRQARAFLRMLDKRKITPEELQVARSAYGPCTSNEESEFIASEGYLRRHLRTELSDDQSLLIVNAG
jgi:hypothetical protein